jgi:hypothetical protein
MDLEHLSVTLRQRNPWEAIDLGFAMVREWWRDLYGVWLAVVIPLAVLACLLLPPQWAAALLWWLKPALDRIVLHVIASAVFGSRPGWRATLRAFPSYAWNGLIGSLLWRRFSLTRSFTLPVRQLENARGAAGRARIAQLRRRVGSHASWLTIVCLHFESVALLSLIGLYVLLMPGASENLSSSFSWYQHLDNDRQAYIGVGLWLTAIALMEPLYVAAGFALYLNRRTVLEGWDLEVQLRRQSQRSGQPPGAHSEKMPPAAIVSILLALAAAWVCWPDVTYAQAPPSSQAQTATPGTAQQQIKEVLKDPIFGTYEQRTRIQSLSSKPKPEAAPDIKGLTAFMQGLAQVLRVAVWVALAIALLAAVLWLLRNVRFQGDASVPAPATPDLLFGLDVRPESLPGDVAAAALAQIARGELVLALSLLYRGALVALLHRHGVELQGGDTEADCLAKIRARVQDSTQGYLARLVASWQAAAYAHRIPPAAEVEALARQWQGVFGTQAER